MSLDMRLLLLQLGALPCLRRYIYLLVWLLAYLHIILDMWALPVCCLFLL